MLQTNQIAGSDLPPTKKHRTDASIFQDSLSVAAKFGYKEEFLSFFNNGVDVHVGERKNPDCGHNCEIETPIEKAIKANQHEITMILFENLDVSKVNLQCMLNRLLILAAQFAGEDTILELINMGAELNPESECRYKDFNEYDEDINMCKFETPLTTAMKYNRKDLVQLLIQCGAYIHEPMDCHNPLFFAATYKVDIEIVKILLELGVNVNAESCKHINVRPLHKAIESGYTEMVELLIQYGADVTAEGTNDKYGEALKHATPLHHAAYFGHFDIVQILVEIGVELDRRNLLGDTALSLCISFGKHNYEISNYLIEKGASINELLKPAIKNQDFEFIEGLLAYGANPNYLVDEPFCDKSYPAALHQALETGNLEIIKLLLKNGAEVALFLLQATKSTDWINKTRMLLKCGVEFDSTVSNNKRTLLHKAIIFYGNLEVVSILINFGVDVNAKDARKRTSLHYAFKRKVKRVDYIEEFNILKTLMENGANPNSRNDIGESTIEKTLKRNSAGYFKAILYNQCKI